MKRRLNRINFVTATNYIELVDGYKYLLRLKRKEIEKDRSKLVKGLEKLNEAQE